jgi:uncharacterized membrane protein YqjE
MSEPAPQGGLFASLRQMLSTLVEIAQVRVQLLGNELEEEKLRIAGGLLLAGVGMMLVTVGTVLLCALVILLLAEGYRLAALAVLTLAFLAGGAFAVRCAGRKLRNPGGMFAATLAELAEDRSGLAPRE